MWENTLNHHRGDHSKCHHPAHQGYQWKNRDMPEAQASLRRYLAEGSKIIQNDDPLSGSTQDNESFHAVKGKYTDKRLNFTTSTEARFVLGMIQELGLASRVAQTRRHFPLPAECNMTLRDLDAKLQRKDQKNKQEAEARKKMRPEISHEQELVGTARERVTPISGNRTQPPQTKPQETIAYPVIKQDMTRKR
jgi:hypothetical protein